MLGIAIYWTSDLTGTAPAQQVDLWYSYYNQTLAEDGGKTVI